MRWKYNCSNYQEIASHGQPGSLPLPQVRGKAVGSDLQADRSSVQPAQSGHDTGDVRFRFPCEKPEPGTLPKPQVPLFPPMAEKNSPTATSALP